MDTNVVSDYLSELLPVKGMAFVSDVIDAIPNVSIISQNELLCWNIKDPSIKRYVENFLSDSHIYEITPDVVLRCVSTRKGKKIKTPDAIIAATPVANGLTLFTINEKDFQHIPILKLSNPMTL